MDEIKKYWRDKVTQILTWGTTVFIAISVWSLTESEKFELGSMADNLSTGNKLRAIGLFIFVFIFSIGWFRIIQWIYTNHLSGEIDGTVIPWKPIKYYVITIGCLLFVIASLLSFG